MIGLRSCGRSVWGACWRYSRRPATSKSSHRIRPRVLIHTSPILETDPNNRWRSQYQKEAGRDNEIMVTIKNLAKGHWYKLRVTDPKDLSPYAWGGKWDDNKRALGDSAGNMVGGLLDVVKGPNTHLVGYNLKSFWSSGLTYYYVESPTGEAKILLKFADGQWRGNNYRVKLYELHGTDKDKELCESGDIVAWDRVYLEMDYMRQGIGLGVGKTVDCRTSRSFTLGGGSLIPVGQKLLFSDDSSSAEEEAIVQSVDVGLHTPIITLDRYLTRVYSGDNNAGIGIEGWHYDSVDFSQIKEAYGDINNVLAITGSTAGCFVDFAPIPASKNAHQIMRHKFFLKEDDANAFLAPYFDHDRENVIHVGCVDTVGETLQYPTSGLTESLNYWSLVGVGHISGISPGGGSSREVGRVCA